MPSLFWKSDRVLDILIKCQVKTFWHNLIILKDDKILFKYCVKWPSWSCYPWLVSWVMRGQYLSHCPLLTDNVSQAQAGNIRLQLQHWPALRAKTGFESQHGFSSNCIDQRGVMLSVNWPIVGGNSVTDRWRVNGNIKILFVMIWSCTMSGISVFYHRAFCFR